ncbi:Crp/Fnr family transcriptional regulator [Streptomyces sp. NPDC004838]
MEPRTLIDQLADNVLFADVPGSVAADLTGRGTVRHCARSQVIFEEGQAGGSVFCLAAGKVKLMREGVTGRQEIYMVVGPGDVFGNLDPFGPPMRLGSAVAMTPSLAVEFDRDALRWWITTHHAAAIRVFQIAVDRANTLLEVMEDLLAPEISTRVARVLLRHAERFGRVTSEGVRVTLDMSQHELAHHVGASRERVNRTLSGFARRGWVTRDGSDYVLSDMDSLNRHTRVTDARRVRHEIR